jgi:hypothetical protein
MVQLSSLNEHQRYSLGKQDNEEGTGHSTHEAQTLYNEVIKTSHTTEIAMGL